MFTGLRTGFVVLSVAGALLLPSASAFAAGSEDTAAAVLLPQSTESVDAGITASYQGPDHGEYTDAGVPAADNG